MIAELVRAWRAMLRRRAADVASVAKYFLLAGGARRSTAPRSIGERDGAHWRPVSASPRCVAKAVAEEACGSA